MPAVQQADLAAFLVYLGHDRDHELLCYQNGQHGGVYVWDSPESMRAFQASELSRSIRDVYQVREPALDIADVVLALRHDSAPSDAACAPALHPT